ncbi:serine/threonine protein kinase [Synechococcus sp. PCC 7502]|uniref:serine/threonine-protein kinase n=1 Tax=Synechococcus sp. PCC 7502 TaxID=1173263 RepID=UPI00029FE4CB|nr:serine/threonine-protein kinase [Synechococcus sp. PCC 7502]AFY72480.1 serine/threonine protein kinase [Synechococcus sp. PCC 7502]
MLLNNRYKILRSLGSGGFGETFVAEDTQMPSGRHCVIKKLRPISHDPEVYQLVKARFHREAAILEDLGNHPQIPSLYAYFEENQDFYLVQELIDGVTLSDAMQKQASYSENFVIDFLLNFLPVLDYVHSKRIIHRDIKPDNIIIRQLDQKPVLIDFGAVKESMSTSLAVAGNLVSTITIGTPGFMPSEQAAGRPVYSSDLYATGLTAIYLLTGKQPHQMETDYSSGEVLWQQYVTIVSPNLAAILSKAISPHARDRYGTATEVMQALQTITPSSTNPTAPIAVQPNSNSAPTSYYEPTVAISPRYIPPEPTASKTPNKFSEFYKTLLIGLFLTLGIILGFWLTRSPQSSEQVSKQDSDQNLTPPAPNPTIPKPAPNDPVENITPKTEPTPSPPPEPSEPDTVTPNKTSPVPSQPEVLAVEDAEIVIQSLYDHVSNQEWKSAKDLFTQPLASQFDPNFFQQFSKVTVENLELTSKTDTSMSFVGTNTYFYPDGSKQIEERSYTVQFVNKIPLISGSEFIRVVKAR